MKICSCNENEKHGWTTAKHCNHCGKLEKSEKWLLTAVSKEEDQEGLWNEAYAYLAAKLIELGQNPTPYNIIQLLKSKFNILRKVTE